MSKDSLLKEFLSLVDVENFETVYSKDITEGKYFGFPLKMILESEKRLRDESEGCIAYFSMEYGLATSFYNSFSSNRKITENNKLHENEVFSNSRVSDFFFTLKLDKILDLPIYSGGLGVLAGDTVKTMADYKAPVAAVGMLWNSGYFKQRFWFKYGQLPEALHWDHYSYPGLIPLRNRVKISLNNRDIHLRLWKYYVYSYKHDYALPLILLDSNIEANNEDTRHLTDQLYRSDKVSIKILQRVILGMGGIAALDGLGYKINTYHLNEGHAVFAFVARAGGGPEERIQDLKNHFVYTCHTPVEAGHDRFSTYELGQILRSEHMVVAERFGRENDNTINLTLLSMNIASRINAVAKSHQKVMQLQFQGYRDRIKAVTNGVHTHTWISESFFRLFEEFSADLGDIRSNPMALKNVTKLTGSKKFRSRLWQAHQENKAVLCALLSKWGLSKDVITVCWARRVAAYKRPSMILYDPERLVSIARKFGPIQIIIAGKAHPNDNMGFTYISEMLDKVDRLSREYGELKVVMLENYEIFLGKILTSGVDIWLNNPLPPFEASGTSGMKAILNGVIQVSTLDGWVCEAADKNIGRIFGYKNPEGQIGSEGNLRLPEDSAALYQVLEEMVSMYYNLNSKKGVETASPWVDMMINCLAAGAYFNTYRMLDEYKNIWDSV